MEQFEAGVTGAVISALATNKDLQSQVYKDLASPAVTQLGKALGSIMTLGTLPIVWAAERAELWKDANLLEAYAAKLARIPAERTLAVSPEVGVPILERAAYVRDKMLSELFAELLAKASDADQVRYAHPGFIHVIDCLSPDEAALLEMFAPRTVTAMVLPVVGMDHVNHVFGDRYYLDVDMARLTFPDNLNGYLSNLEGLGLIKRLTRVLEPEDVDYFNDFKDRLARRNVPESESLRQFGYAPDSIVPTPWCRMFMRAVFASLSTDAAPK